jgi:hypothetical protein
MRVPARLDHFRGRDGGHNEFSRKASFSGFGRRSPIFAHEWRRVQD